MARGHLDGVMHQLRRLVGAEPLESGSDGQLLARFVAEHDEAAFAALTRRYGPLVLGVCRRVLHDPHAVDDAFQATFLVLARKAASIAKQDSLGSWLHGVAYRIAVRARVGASRRRVVETLEADMAHADPSTVDVGPESAAEIQELSRILDEELQRLPEKHRGPLVRCYLMGQTNEEAARELHCPPGSMSWRLAQARECLRQRLTRRGATLSAATLATALSAQAAPAAVPAALLAAALRTGTTPGAVSAAATELADAILPTLGVSKIKMGAAGLVFGLAVVGIGVLVHGLSSGSGAAHVAVVDPAADLAGAQPRPDPGAADFKLPDDPQAVLVAVGPDTHVGWDFQLRRDGSMASRARPGMGGPAKTTDMPAKEVQELMQWIVQEMRFFDMKEEHIDHKGLETVLRLAQFKDMTEEMARDRHFPKVLRVQVEGRKHEVTYWGIDGLPETPERQRVKAILARIETLKTKP